LYFCNYVLSFHFISSLCCCFIYHYWYIYNHA